jgi:glutamine synthetase
LAGSLTFIGTCDLVAITRGRAIRSEEFASHLRRGVGWVPADLAQTTFGSLAVPNPFGVMGDIRLLPVESAECRLPGLAGRPSTQLVLADIVHPDGRAWECCPRHALVEAVRDLDERFGLRVVAAFEQEFTLRGLTPDVPFSIEAHRVAEPFGSELVEALHASGFQPETWLPEYGVGQYEITIGPADALTAADRAILVRAIARDLAASHGMRAMFAPLVRPDAVGNGVHVHLSLWDRAGRPVTLDPETRQPSTHAQRFVAGILAHAPALVAWTAPSVVSSIRLAPGRWSSAAAFFGNVNREALVRLCPLTTLGDVSALEMANVEYRACDATANPWLVLAALIRAGIDGLQRELPPPPLVEGDLDAVDPAERERLGIVDLPRDLEAAQAALEEDAVASSWFAPQLLATHLSIRRTEARQLEGMTAEERCRRYADVI